MVSTNHNPTYEDNSTRKDTNSVTMNGDKNTLKPSPAKLGPYPDLNGVDEENSNHGDENIEHEDSPLYDDLSNPPTPASQDGSVDNGYEEDSTISDDEEFFSNGDRTDSKEEVKVKESFSNNASLFTSGITERTSTKPLYPNIETGINGRFGSNQNHSSFQGRPSLYPKIERGAINISSSNISRRPPIRSNSTNFVLPPHRDKDIKNDFFRFIYQNYIIYKGKISEYDQKHLYLGVGFIIVAVAVFAYFIFSPKEIIENKNLKEQILIQYPAQDKNDLKHLFRIIDNVNQGKRETDKVAVITILYSHRGTAECLAKDTANYAVKVLNRNDGYAFLNGSSHVNFGLGDKDFKKEIEDKGVLVVYDFHNFPAENVRHFHGLCDKYTPFIEDKAVYIILLEMSKNQDGVSKKFEKLKSRIEELWSSLKSEILYPLGIRLMDNVLLVRPESNPQLQC